ncbi:MAG: MBL fold metallo-hydrolase [Caldilineaceae bacterium]|nr:MBL fold metallo-hydrolase [Caldilineaceae bacterium]
MIVKGVTVGLLQENCYILGCERTHAGVVIDPGDNPRAILKIVQQQGLHLEKIVNTHAHLDHVMAVDPIRAATGATFHLHEADLPILHDVPLRARLWLDSEIDPIGDPDEFLVHGQVITFGDEQLEVRFTPGHAPGHVVFVHHAGRQVFAGDTLFQGSIGRFDLPGSDGPTLLNSIRTELLTLADDYVIYPGHGSATTIGIERVSNPFVGAYASSV